MNESDALHQSRITKWKGEVGSGENDVTAIQFEVYKRVSTLLYSIYTYIGIYALPCDLGDRHTHTHRHTHVRTYLSVTAAGTTTTFS